MVEWVACGLCKGKGKFAWLSSLDPQKPGSHSSQGVASVPAYLFPPALYPQEMLLVPWLEEEGGEVIRQVDPMGGMASEGSYNS